MSKFKEFVQQNKQQVKNGQKLVASVTRREAKRKKRGRNKEVSKSDFSLDVISRTSSVQKVCEEYGIPEELARTLRTKHFFKFDRHDRNDMTMVFHELYRVYGVLPCKFKNLYSYVNSMLPYDYSKFVISSAFEFHSNRIRRHRIINTYDVLFGKRNFRDVVKDAHRSFVALLTKKEIASLYNCEKEPLDALCEMAITKYGINKHVAHNAVERVVGQCLFSTAPLIQDTVLKIIAKFTKSNDIHIIDYLNTTTHTEREELCKQGIERIRHASDMWHDMMKMAKLSTNVSWDTKFPSKSYPLQTNDDGFVTKELVIEPITSAKGLLSEGRRMSHCVYGYVDKCMSGRSEILSIYLKHYGMVKGVSTVEYYNATKSVVQHYGKANTPPSSLAVNYLQRYMRENNF